MDYNCLPYRSIMAVDFEFRGVTGGSPDVVCMVAKDLLSGELYTLWSNELYMRKECPFPTGEDSLVLTYAGTAEAACIIALGWELPENHLDLYVEFKNMVNGDFRWKCGYGLLSALKYFRLPCLYCNDKTFMRELILSQSEYTDKEKSMILQYCESDVVALESLLPKMLPSINIDQALLRGQYMLGTAKIEHAGIPLDVDRYKLISNNLDGIRNYLIERVDRNYGVYVGGSFNESHFHRYVQNKQIDWPLTESGACKRDKETFKMMSLIFPEFYPLGQLRKTLSSLHKFSLPVGNDQCVRCHLAPFASKTSRNQPSTSSFVYGLPKWLRGLIRPPEGYGLAYIDYSQQEFGIAAALSGDVNMQDAYHSGDPYLTMAKQSGRVPQNATKESHPEERKLFKEVVLATQYCMGAQSLGQRLGRSALAAKELLKLHRQVYRQFWKWIQNRVDQAYLDGYMETVYGWRLQVSSETNRKTVQNYPMQANGSEILRLACCFAHDYGVKICAPVHDALLIEAPLEILDDAVAKTQDAMRKAGEYVLDGFVLRTDVECFRYPERHHCGGNDDMWDLVSDYLESNGK